MWSWGLSVVTLVGFWITGSGKPWGWGFCLLVTQPLWAAYAVATDQHGFLSSTAAFAFVYARNWRRACRSVTPSS